MHYLHIQQLCNSISQAIPNTQMLVVATELTIPVNVLILFYSSIKHHSDSRLKILSLTASHHTLFMVELPYWCILCVVKSFFQGLPTGSLLPELLKSWLEFQVLNISLKNDPGSVQILLFGLYTTSCSTSAQWFSEEDPLGSRPNPRWPEKQAA